MTPKDYTLLAECFNRVRKMGALDLTANVDPLTWHMLRSAVAAALKSDNEQFNFTRFYFACGHFPVPVKESMNP